MKKFLYIPIFIFISGCTSLPDAKVGIPIEKSFWAPPTSTDEGPRTPTREAWQYKQNGQEVNTLSVFELLSKNEKTKSSMSFSKKYYYFQKIGQDISILYFVYGLTQPNDFRLNYTVGPLLFITISAIYGRLQTDDLDKAVDIYNQDLPAYKNEKTHFEILPTLPNGNLGIAFKFDFL